jgi:hypothetical protein
MYDMKVYWGRTDRARQCDSNKCEVTELALKTHAHGHKLHVDKLFSAPELFDDLAKKEMYSCSTVRPNRRRMPQDLKRPLLTVSRSFMNITNSVLFVFWYHSPNFLDTSHIYIYIYSHTHIYIRHCTQFLSPYFIKSFRWSQHNTFQWSQQTTHWSYLFPVSAVIKH